MDVPRDIMTRYLARREKELEDCQECLLKKKFDELERVGHQLKGNGMTFGHPELSKLGQELEAAAIKNDSSAIKKILDHFSEWVDHNH